MVDKDDLGGARHVWGHAEGEYNFLNEEEEDNEGDLNEAESAYGPVEGGNDFVGEDNFAGAVGALGGASHPAIVASMRPSEQQLGIIELSTGGSESDGLGDIEEQIDLAHKKEKINSDQP